MKRLSLSISALASLVLVYGCAHTDLLSHIPPPMAISPSTAPAATVALPYQFSLNATGGTAPYTWSIVSGSLPAGLSLDANSGIVSGTPTTAGTANFTVQLSDSSVPARTSSLVYAITVNGILSFSSSTLPNGTLGVAYNAGPSITGGASPFAWSVVSGSLPPGLSLNPSTGAITGTPTATGSFSIGIQVTDASAPAQTAKIFTSIVINSLLAITTPAVASGAVGAAYSATLNASGGVGQVTWSISAGALPAGLSLSSAGVISGTPSATGSSSFTVQVTDSASPPRAATASWSMMINAHFTVANTPVPTGTTGVAYTFTPSVTGGTAPYAWSVVSGSLPGGLSLNSATGTIAGTPGATGTYGFVLQVIDSSAPAQTATYPISIVIYAPLVVSSTTLPTAFTGSFYSTTLTASNAVSATTWAITNGTLPNGFTLNGSTGVISGSTSTTGTSNFTVQVTDSATPPRTASAAISITTTTALSFAPATMPDGVTGVPYSSSLAASGGIAPYTWSISSGSLPFGMTISPSTGTIGGTCPGSGGFTFTVRVADSSSPPQSTTATDTIHVYGQLTITTTTLSDATANSAYSATLQAFGGNSSYTWSITSGSLPTGITLDPSTGIISGTPTATGTSNFTAQVTDTSNPPQSTSQSLSLNVDAEGANNALLKGSYAILFQGFDSSGAVAIAGSIDADGDGHITAGTLDANRTSGAQTGVAIDSGTFSINADDRGTMTVHSSFGTQTFQVAVNAAGTLVRFIEFDPPGPAVIRGNGVMKLRDPSAYSNAAVSGNYAIGLSGSNAVGGRSALIGAFSTDRAGGIPAGLVDGNSAGTVTSSATVSPASNYNIANDGRGTLMLSVPGFGTVSGVIYVVSAKEEFVVRTDTFNTGSDLLAGEILQQSGSPYSSLPLTGVIVLHMDGSAASDSTSVSAGLFSSTNSGALTGTYDLNDAGLVSSISAARGSYRVTSATTGRGTMSFAGNDWVFYLVDSTTAFAMDAAGSTVMMGMFEGQQAELPLPAAVSGKFIEGSQNGSDASVTFESGAFHFAPTGSFSGAADENASGGSLISNVPLGGAIVPSADGRVADGNGKIYYIISAKRLVEMDAKPGQVNPSILIADQ